MFHIYIPSFLISLKEQYTFKHRQITNRVFWQIFLCILMIFILQSNVTTYSKEQHVLFPSRPSYLPAISRILLLETLRLQTASFSSQYRSHDDTLCYS